MISQPHGPDPAAQVGNGSILPASTRVVAGQNGLGQKEAGQAQPLVTPAFVIRALRRWWKIATPVGLLMATVAVTYMYLTFTPSYRASAWLRIQERNPMVVYSSEGASTRTFVHTQVQLLTSPLVLEQVLAQGEVARSPGIVSHPNPIGFLTRGIKITARPDSELFVIGFEAPEPKEAALLANATVDAYFKMHSQDEQLRAQRVIELLEDERERRRVLVQGLRANLRDMRKASMGPKVDQQLMADEQTLKVPLADLHRRITAKEVEQELERAKMRAFEESIASGVVEIDPEVVRAEMGKNSLLRELREASTEMRKKMDEILKVAAQREQHPTYQQLVRQKAETDRAIDDTEERLRRTITEVKVAEKLKQQQKKLESMQRNIEDSQLEIEIFRKRYFDQREELVKVSGPTMDFSFKVAELKREERVFELIANRIQRLRTEMRAPARITLLKKATAPKLPTSRIKTKKVAFTALMVFCVPFGLAVAWERFVCRVDGPQTLWQADLAVVGEIAKLPVTASGVSLGSGETAVGRDVSLFEESIDSLRTCLVLANPTTESRILVVSSAVSGEGKTSVASQLAVSIARSSGEATLLIDADMRSPDIHNVFDIPNEPGFAEVLSHECELDQAIITSWSNYVHLLPAGLLKASPHKLLGNGSLKPLLQQLRSRYKHIIIDTSPVLSASESLVLAKAADATLLCAMRDVSRVDQVQRAFERLVNTGARPLGTVLNGVPTSRYAYLYGVYAYQRR